MRRRAETFSTSRLSNKMSGSTLRREKCSICLEKGILDTKLGCGHSFHRLCLSKHFKQECALCRAPQNVVAVTGVVVKNVEFDVSEEKKPESLASIYKRILEERKAEYSKMSSGNEDEKDVEEESSDYADHDARSSEEDYDL